MVFLNSKALLPVRSSLAKIFSTFPNTLAGLFSTDRSMLTWSSCPNEVGMLSALAREARNPLFSLAKAAVGVLVVIK